MDQFTLAVALYIKTTSKGLEALLQPIKNTALVRSRQTCGWSFWFRSPRRIFNVALYRRSYFPLFRHCCCSLHEEAGIKGQLDRFPRPLTRDEKEAMSIKVLLR